MLATGIVFLACSFSQWKGDKKMNEMPKGLVVFSVNDKPPLCAKWKDNMPKVRNEDAYRKYIAARKLFRSKVEYQFSREELEWIFDNVKIAADRGDWGAKALLAKFLREGLGPLSSNRVLEQHAERAVKISLEAMEAGQPWGFYDLGVAYEHGYGGIEYSPSIAWAYYLKAAKLGSPDAQMALSQAYMDAGKREFALTMMECAYRQGHGAAAYELALLNDVTGKPSEALALYHAGVKFGSQPSASFLSIAFRSQRHEEEILKPLGFAIDVERARRYDIIADALAINPDLRFSRLDEVLPLPPKPLPEWRGIEAAMTPEPEGPPTY
ncbi:sel1 repeat family protein [Duganella ginsengisoli]|uniref:Sel1 repeat family protein n=2 Tax=Pseudoduganella ginsengisoli TaxID=1462440 RepID=A0A6L6PUT2_9BURK|nr:sel1 repeat family protein [Pseudoduganella ginsengisoli]